MNHQQKAEQYVREQLPDLVKNKHAQLQTWKGETVYFTEYHPIQLQHWLRVLGENFVGEYRKTGGLLLLYTEQGLHICTFDLTTGQPATEDDYKAFNEIVGV